MNPSGVFINGKYEIFEVVLGKGGYGEVFLGKSAQEEVAIKYEREFSKEKCLANEATILKDLCSKKASKNVGIPKFYDFIPSKDGNYLILELLGQSLKERQNISPFSLEEIGKIGIDLLNSIEFIHECSYVYVDVKPENFLFGKSEETKDKLYIVDYGCSQSYLDSTGKHKKYSEEYNMARGSIYYASIWNHYGIEYFRRDDVIALGFVLLKLIKGKLPWEGLNLTYNDYEFKVLSLKVRIEDDREYREEFYKNVPKFLKTYMDYCMNLKTDQTPDYVYLRSVISKIPEN